MINTELLDKDFTQHYNSCVMASYAIVSNYFNSRISISEIFDAYCDHFNIPWVTQLESESHCSNHINFICPYILHWHGYDMVDYLHNHSNIDIFVRNRRLFTTEVIKLNPLTEDLYDELITGLRNNVALANILIIDNDAFHSKTLGIDEKTQDKFTHDTALGTGSKITTNVDLKYNSIRECIVYMRI